MDDRVSEVLRSFYVDPKLGFLLPDPQTRLPTAFAPWHQIADELPELVEAGKVEERIANLSVIDVGELHSHRELRLAHLLLCTLAAAYVWNKGPDKAPRSLPRQLAIPLTTVCERLGFKPIICHASACLANWRPLRDEKTFRAENLDLIAFRFIRHPGNVWFFTITAQIETEFAGALVAIAKSCLELEIFEDTFYEIRKAFSTALATLKRMKERNPPSVFYNDFRRYLSGYTQGKFCEQSGMIFEGREDLGPQFLSGCSAAQSSTLSTIDAFLCIEHTGEEQKFLHTQRQYMAPKHKEFIEWVEQRAISIPNLRSSPEYQDTVAALRHFRSEHIKIAATFIVLQAKNNEPRIGTGGTSFMKLLKTIRDDC